MEVIGVAAEFNPFHKGHAHLLRESRRAAGGDAAVVCVMSGCFVQRGEPAILAPHARGEMAVRAGADLVLELPVPWALASAEGFARGAVGLLAGLGVVTRLSFGSESGDLPGLEALAEALLEPDFSAALAGRPRAGGESYAAARQALLEQRIGPAARTLEGPNNILAVEYLKALRRLKSPIRPMTVLRAGAAHDALVPKSGREEAPWSASALRAGIRSGADIRSGLPEACREILERERALGRGPADPERLETALLSRLRCLPERAFAALPDAGEGLENRLFRAARQGAGLEEVLAAAKTKGYALARLRRMCWGAGVGLTRALGEGAPPYARVLAANARGRVLLRRIEAAATVPVITKPAEVRTLDGSCAGVFQAEAAAWDLWALGCPGTAWRAGGGIWRQSPVMV